MPSKVSLQAGTAVLSRLLRLRIEEVGKVVQVHHWLGSSGVMRLAELEPDPFGFNQFAQAAICFDVREVVLSHSAQRRTGGGELLA